MNSCWLQLLSILLILLYVHAFNEPSSKFKMTYKPRTAEQLRSYHANRPHLMRQKLSGQSKYYMPNYPKDVLSFYYNIGTPALTFILNIETGRKHIWLIDGSYPNVTGDNAFKYYANKSSTSVKTGDYVEGFTGLTFLEGVTYTDKVRFMDGRAWIQEFAAITNSVDENGQREVFPISGMMGFAWDPNEDTVNLSNKSSPILNLLKLRNHQQLYSLYLERDPDGKFAEGEMTIGSIDNDTCGPDITWIPLTYYDLYAPLAFKVEGFQLGDYKTRKGGMGKVDSGLPVVFLPLDQYNAVYKALKPDYDFNLNILTTDCSNKGKFPSMLITIKGRDFTVKSTYYVMDIGLDNNRCAVTIEASDDKDVNYAFGNPLLREYCQHYDVKNQQLGLSTSLFEPA